ncbi:hypothetical protein EVAR_4591_1 [Eumeta japonica]|uniref:Uncharacterized protein n=1 Tax=Eumeta variegata TaxID=151549 RepID=A0A4C1SWX0_EUMVA|nr:hypothetical protein EVAR_4591_1 [Eumeta japonica]
MAQNHPNPLIVSTATCEPPPAHHFLRRPRNVLSDPPDALTLEVEKGSRAPSASLMLPTDFDEDVKAYGLTAVLFLCFFRRSLVRESRTHLCARAHRRPIMGFSPPSPSLSHGENYKSFISFGRIIRATFSTSLLKKTTVCLVGSARRSHRRGGKTHRFK